MTALNQDQEITRDQWEIDGSGRMTDALAYDPETGIFTWKKNGRGRTKRTGAIAGAAHSNGYVRIKVDGRTYFAHRLAWLFVYGEWPKCEIDHVNGNRADNRIANLRQATTQQNRWNTAGIPKRRKYSKHKGVTKEHKSNKWVAQIYQNGKSVRLGIFAAEDQAAAAYQSAAKAMRGDFAK